MKHLLLAVLMLALALPAFGQAVVVKDYVGQPSNVPVVTSVALANSGSASVSGISVAYSGRDWRIPQGSLPDSIAITSFAPDTCSIIVNLWAAGPSGTYKIITRVDTLATVPAPGAVKDRNVISRSDYMDYDLLKVVATQAGSGAAVAAANRKGYFVLERYFHLH